MELGWENSCTCASVSAPRRVFTLCKPHPLVPEVLEILPPLVARSNSLRLCRYRPLNRLGGLRPEPGVLYASFYLCYLVHADAYWGYCSTSYGDEATALTGENKPRILLMGLRRCKVERLYLSSTSTLLILGY